MGSRRFAPYFSPQVIAPSWGVRLLKNMKKSILFFTLIFLQISGCDSSSKYFDVREGEDISTNISPNENYNALIRKVDISGSVMVSQPYQVIVEDKFGNSQVILLADKKPGVTIKWVDLKTLSICYEKETKIREFRNSFGFYRENAPYVEGEVILNRKELFEECSEA
mgnify:CR=1 FL=1